MIMLNFIQHRLLLRWMIVPVRSSGSVHLRRYRRRSWRLLRICRHLPTPLSYSQSWIRYRPLNRLHYRIQSMIKCQLPLMLQLFYSTLFNRFPVTIFRLDSVI